MFCTLKKKLSCDMKLFLIVIIVHKFCKIVEVNSSSLPVNIILHLDKSYAGYLDTLQPWNYIKVPIKANLSTLEYVIGVFRHGNKPPTESYVGDKYPFYDKRYWPNGYSQLTNVGKHQLYSVGKILRQRYDGFLSTKYKREEIIVRSNPVDRVYFSASYLLAGLYQLHGSSFSNDLDKYIETEWQPIPIWDQLHDMSQVAKNPEVCPLFYQMEKEVERKINEYTYQYQDLVDYLNNCTGLGVDNLRDLFRYWNLAYFQEQEGYERPDWAANGVMEILTNLASSTFTALLSTNPEMRKLMAGPLIEQFSTEIRGKTALRDVSLLSRKMHLEGGHGTTLNAILPALGFNEPFVPNVGSVFLLELHTSSEGYYIQTLYLNDIHEDNIDLMEIPDCGYECPLSRMLDLMDEVAPVNWKVECQISFAQQLKKTSFHILCSLMIVVLLLWKSN